jgi:hypothetical protein
MIRSLNDRERRALRLCVRHYIALARKLRDCRDVSEDLKDEFERNVFAPMCQLAAGEASVDAGSPCQICGLGGGRRGARGCLHEIESLNDYQLAAEIYLGLDPGPVERLQLWQALRRVISEHLRILRRRSQTLATA